MMPRTPRPDLARPAAARLRVATGPGRAPLLALLVALLVALLGLLPGAHGEARAQVADPMPGDAQAAPLDPAPPELPWLPEDERRAGDCRILYAHRIDRFAPPSARDAESYELLLRISGQEAWRAWAREREAAGASADDEPRPEGIVFTAMRSAEHFEEDGRLTGTAELLTCPRDPTEEEDPFGAAFDPDPHPEQRRHRDLALEADTFSEINRIGFMAGFDSAQRHLSRRMTDFSSAVDEYFSGAPVSYETTGSSARLRLDTVFEERGQSGFDVDVRLKIVLPATQDKLRIFVESDPEPETAAPRRTLAESPDTAARDDSYFAGVQAIFGEPESWSFRPSLGIKVRSPIDTLVRFRLQRPFNPGPWRLLFSETVFWFDSLGWGESTNLVAEAPITETLLFRSITGVQWTRLNEYFELGQSFALIETLSAKRSISYEALVFGLSEPTLFARDYLLTVRYRQLIHSDYMFVELFPEVFFTKERDFEDEHSFTIRFELLFTG